MPCTPALTVNVDKDSIRFKASCSGKCTGGGKCVPIIEPDITHDRRFRVRHAGVGKDYELDLDVEEKVENFTLHARCQCGDQAEGDETYKIILHDPSQTEEMILNILSLGVRVIIKALLK